MRYAVVPTRRPDPRIFPLVDVLRRDGIRVVIPTTAEPDFHLPGACFIRQKNTFDGWVNEALDFALSEHPDPRVAVVNDDLSLQPGALGPMFDALDAHDLVGLSGWEQTVTPSPLRGHLFALRANRMRLPEVEGHALWWWNTDDFYHQAIKDGKRVVFVPVALSHVSENENGDGSWRYPAEFSWSVQADHDYFWSKWHHLDPAHEGCYLSWWPDALPAGQKHRTEWSG